MPEKKEWRAAKTPNGTPPPRSPLPANSDINGGRYSMVLPSRAWAGFAALANLMFPALSHVVQRPLMTVKYNAKLLSYFNCKSVCGGGRVQRVRLGVQMHPRGMCTFQQSLHLLADIGHGRGQGSRNIVHKNVPQILPCSLFQTVQPLQLLLSSKHMKRFLFIY